MEGNPTHTCPRRLVLGVCESLTVIEKRLDSILDELHDAPRNAKSRDHVLKSWLRAFNGSEAIIVSLTELGVSSETIGRFQEWRDYLFALVITIVATDTARENPDFGAGFSQTFGPIPAPEDDEEEHERLQWIRCGHAIGPVYACQKFIAGLVTHLQLLPTTQHGDTYLPNGEKPEAVSRPSLAMGFLFQESDISPTELAKRVGVSRGTLYSRSAKWKGVRETLMARDTGRIPKGTKGADGVLEAEAEYREFHPGDDDST